ncbi:hypothetical protein D7V97_29385 [Corallococcus sp. CA053C]|uniref:hypothetical protein n=1 Tax=Corallococcus sp. CA053C TaxID=2316732 RepID=UPI000EA1587C|nr:hypothetical protein [Corallococcus sp. CA053C]RKH01108.1 hypothetical protein D7V97_29385 [Corallococcus sp. CA053C]
MRLTSSAALLFAASLATACGGPLEEEPQTAPVVDESLASQEQGVDESCVGSSVVLAQPDGASVGVVYPRCSYADFFGTSNDGTYDQTSCPHRFVTELTNLNGTFARPFVEAIPATANVTESACKAALIAGAAFGYANGYWYSLGNVSTAGIWHPATPGPISFPAYCQFRFSIGNGASGYTKMRVTGIGAALGVFPMRVRTGVSVGNGPC